MGLNFRKSLAIGKLIRLNFSKSGVSASAGVKGARISIGKNGVRETISLPGTGLSWSERQAFKKRKKAEQSGSTEKNSQMKRNSKIKTFIWIAFVAGAFLLYRSGAFDEPIAKIKQMIAGKGTVMSVSETGNAVAGTSSAVGANNEIVNGSASSQGSDVQSTGDSSSLDGAAVTTDSSDNNGSSTSDTTEYNETMTTDAGVNDKTDLSPDGQSVNATKVTTVLLKDGSVVLDMETLFVASKSGEKFHKADCRHVKSIVIKNLIQYTTREEAVLEKEPCTVCNP